RVPAHERLELENGTTLLLLPRREVPLLACQLLLRGGARGDPPTLPGVASLVAALLEKGAGRRDAYAFAEAVEGAGGSFTAGAAAEAITVRSQFMARDQGLMLELLADALRAPRLAPEEFAHLRDRQIEFIKAVKDSEPAELLDAYGRALLFSGHPYGRAVHGSESSLAAITLADAQEYYRRHFGAERLLLVLAGDLDLRRAEAAVRAALATWPRTPAPLPPLASPPAASARRVLLVDAPGAAQSHFWIGAPGVSKRYPRRAALDLVNTLFGGRFTSLLNVELRIKSGLSYGARSGFVRGSAGGDFTIRSFVETANTGQAIRLALQALERLRGEGVSAEMLQSARAYTLGQYALGLETAADWAAALADIEFFGLGTGYIDDYAAELAAVDREAAQAVIAEAFPDPRNAVLVVIGDAARIGAQLEGFGPMVRMRLNDPQFSPEMAGDEAGP
ncbi:MAG: M16 family metallopeptidase, partial [Steroidobacteraceae bacterium]